MKCLLYFGLALGLSGSCSIQFAEAADNYLPPEQAKLDQPEASSRKPLTAGIEERFIVPRTVGRALVPSSGEKKQANSLSAGISSGGTSAITAPGVGSWGAKSGPWGVSSGSWGTKSGPWGVSSGSWGVKSVPWGVSSGSWGTKSGSWGVSSGSWGVKSVPWGVSSGSWGVKSGSWGVSSGSWGVKSGS